MHSETITKTSTNVDKRIDLPNVGDIISSMNLVPIPVNYSIVNGEQRWTTYATYEDGQWFLSWNPYRGLAVFMHKKDFEELRNYPWIRKVQVTNVLKRAIVVKSYE